MQSHLRLRLSSEAQGLFGKIVGCRNAKAAPAPVEGPAIARDVIPINPGDDAWVTIVRWRRRGGEPSRYHYRWSSHSQQWTEAS